MPKKCESCKHFWSSGTTFESGRCRSAYLVAVYSRCLSVDILKAREVCDREGDGVFVYFEPKRPAAGRAFAKAA